MRALQFWFLLLCSSFVCLLYIKQIFVTRAVNQEQRLLAESQQTVSDGAKFENAWQQLALHIYQAGPNDPALTALLKRENVGIHQNPATEGTSTPSTPPASPGAASSKAPVAPLHPATP